MKRCFLVIIGSLCMHWCYARQQVSMEEAAGRAFHEVAAATARQQALWKIDLYGPILLVDPDTRQVFANVPDSAGLLRQQGEIYTGLLPAGVGIANTATQWSGTSWAMVMLPLPADEHDRINLLAHELFHRAQPALQFTASSPGNNHLDKMEGRILMRLELEALKNALLAATAASRMACLQDAVNFRQYRYQLYRGADSTENLLELNEGLAEYTGACISNRDKQAAVVHFISRINTFLLNPTYVRSFAYQTIPVYGYLLQQSDQYWNQRVTAATSLTTFLISSFSLVLPQGSLKNTVTAAGQRYNSPVITREEAARDKQQQQRVAGFKNQFLVQPHLDIGLENMQVSFDPRNMVPIDTLGTYYPNITVSDNWGVLTVEKGAFMRSDWRRITVGIPRQTTGAHISGNGWTLQLNERYTIVKAPDGRNYLLQKK